MQTPRWISATSGAVADAGTKSSAVQPKAESGVAAEPAATTAPVTSPLPAYTRTTVWYAVAFGEIWPTVAGASSSKYGNSKGCVVTP